MHPKNPFIDDYDFDTLIQHEATLRDYVFINEYGNKTIKFANKHAVKALNRALLKAHYGIIWNIPEKNLCPPIPGRLDYLLHVADLIPKSTLRLLDIGTGANLIYPILATCHFNWQCIGSEVDRESLENAQGIIHKNKALNHVQLRRQKNANCVLQNVIEPMDAFDVVVCNPPFFRSRQEAEQTNQRKTHNLKLKEKDGRNFGGQSNELWFTGGEEAFVKLMVLESEHYKNQVHWFTSLISKKESLLGVQKTLEKTHPNEVRVINMDQGNKKSRIIAWTFC